MRSTKVILRHGEGEQISWLVAEAPEYGVEAEVFVGRETARWKVIDQLRENLVHKLIAQKGREAGWTEAQCLGFDIEDRTNAEASTSNT